MVLKKTVKGLNFRKNPLFFSLCFSKMLENRWCIFICVQRKLPLFMRKDQHNHDHIWPRPRWDTVSKNFCTLSANESCQQSTGGKSCTSNGWDWKSMSKVKRPTKVSFHYCHEYTLQLENIWAFNPFYKCNFRHNNQCFHLQVFSLQVSLLLRLSKTRR